MPNPLHYRLRIRNADDSADALVLSSVPGDDHPYLAIPEDGPSGDGQTIDPVTGESMVGAYTVPVIDASGTVALGDVVVASDDVESYADTAAALAGGWAEVDDAGIVTVSLDTTVSDTGAQSIKAVIVGTLGAGQTAKLYRTFTGLTPGHTYTVRKRALFTGTWTGVTLGAWIDFDDGAVVADGSGELIAQVFVVHGGSIAVNATVWLDNVQVIDVGATAGVDRVVTGTLADADGRWDILDRKAFLEESEDVGSAWAVLCAGYVTDVKFDNALVSGITVSETRRADSTLRIFDTYDESLGKPTCIIGGPVEGGFAGMRDYGPAVFKVSATDADKVTLRYDSGPLPPFYYDWASQHLRGVAVKEVNRRAADYFVEDHTWGGIVQGHFPALVARLYSATSGSLTGEFTPLSQPGLLHPVAGLLAPDRLLNDDGDLFLDWPSSGAPVAQPSTGTRFNLYLFPTKISDTNPLHLSGHPIDIDTAILTAKGIAYDAASAATVKDALGAVTAVLYRLTSGDTVSGWCQRCLRGPFGYTLRQNDAGEREYILVRPRETATPTATITLDDLRGGDEGPDGVVFDLDASSKQNVVTVHALNFRSWTDDDKDAGVERPPDFILATPHTISEEMDSDGDGTPDWETGGRKEVTYDLPGTIAFNAAQVGGSTSSLSQLVTSIASEVFAIRGRGAPVGDAMILRGTDADAARVGDFVLVNCDHIPSTDTTQSPTGVRGGTVVAQVLRRTRVAGGADLHLEYRGTATQTGLTPTFTVTKNADDPRHTATFTLTNAAALAAAGAVVRVQMATGTSTPTAGAPLRVINPATDPTAFDLPGQDAGTKVWASARAEVGVEAPGAYTAFAGVTLDSLTAPSGLSASVSSNQVTMSWTVGDADVPEEIIFKLSGEADYRAPIPVAAGTNHYTLILPVAGTYTVGVREHESPPYSG
jgi:hypothetical protein